MRLNSIELNSRNFYHRTQNKKNSKKQSKPRYKLRNIISFMRSVGLDATELEPHCNEFALKHGWFLKILTTAVIGKKNYQWS